MYIILSMCLKIGHSISPHGKHHSFPLLSPLPPPILDKPILCNSQGAQSTCFWQSPTPLRQASDKIWSAAFPSPEQLSKTSRWWHCERRPHHPWPGKIGENCHLKTGASLFLPLNDAGLEIQSLLTTIGSWVHRVHWTLTHSLSSPQLLPPCSCATAHGRTLVFTEFPLTSISPQWFWSWFPITMTTKYPITPKWDGGSQLNSRWRMHKPRLWLNGMATNGPAPSADKVLLRWGVDPVARFSSLWDWGHLTSETSGRVWDGVGCGKYLGSTIINYPPEIDVVGNLWLWHPLWPMTHIRISLSEHLQPISSPATVFLQVHALCGSRCLWHLRHHISRIQHLQPEWCQFFLCEESLRHWARHNRNKNDNTIDLFCSSLLNIMCLSVFVCSTGQRRRKLEKKRNETWQRHGAVNEQITLYYYMWFFQTPKCSNTCPLKRRLTIRRTHGTSMSNLRDKNVFKPQQALVIFVKIIQFGETTKNLKRIGFVKMMGLETMENST